MKGFTAFKLMAPDRVVEVIEDGPFPLVEYSGSKITRRDKQMGIMRFKGGDTRNRVVKSSQQAIVYYDPDFATEEYRFTDVPGKVIQRHEMYNVVEEFKKL